MRLHSHRYTSIHSGGRLDASHRHGKPQGWGWKDHHRRSPGGRGPASGRWPSALVDTDPMQGMTQWWDARAEDAPILFKGEVAKLMPSLRQQGFKLLVVDTLPSIGPEVLLARIIHEKCTIKAKPLISFATMRMGCLMKFFAMKSLAQVFGGLGRFRAVR